MSSMFILKLHTTIYRYLFISPNPQRKSTKSPSPFKESV